MKKIIIFTTAYAFAFVLYSQIVPNDTTNKINKGKSVIKLGPLHFLADRYNIGYEFFFSKYSKSVYFSPSIVLRNGKEDKSSGVVADLQQRFHVYRNYSPTKWNMVFLLLM